WNGLAWSTVGNGFGNGLNGRLTALATASNGDVYAGGYFTQAGGVAAYGVAKWNGTVWSTLGIGTVIGNTSSSGIISLAVASNGDVYAGGNFTQIGGVAANNIARWNGTSWSSLGTGVSGGTGGAMATVYSLAIAANGTVYAGGNFTQAGGVAVSYIAQWSGTAWSPLGAGLNASANSYTSGANALAVASNGDVYAGGTFTQAGGVAAKGVAKWNGAVWSSLGTGATNGVTYVASYGTFDGVVSALKIAANGDIYLAGSFTHAGGIGANNVAKWNGTAWSSVGTSFSNGVSESVSDLVITGNGDVYVGGFLFLARWNGTAWSSLGTGVSIGGSTSLSARCSLAPGPASRVYVGGIFTTVGDGSKVMTHFGIYDPNAVLATAATLRVVPDALFPNPARGTATLRLPATALRLPIVLTDALGREVRRYPVPASSEAELDLRGLPAGTYVVRCGEVSQRLMIE
ncbi:MAG: T9SS type A sorting domain-containing protein, partial [Hymenobacter sp.]